MSGLLDETEAILRFVANTEARLRPTHKCA